MRKTVVMIAACAALPAAPAYAIQDVTVPAGECAASTQAVGAPAGPVLNSTSNAGPVNATDRPGQSDRGLDNNARHANC